MPSRPLITRRDNQAELEGKRQQEQTLADETITITRYIDNSVIIEVLDCTDLSIDGITRILEAAMSGEVKEIAL